MEPKSAFTAFGVILFGAGILFKLLGWHPLGTKPISYIIIANTFLIISLIMGQKKEE
jgi:hypothetical protein